MDRQDIRQVSLLLGVEEEQSNIKGVSHQYDGIFGRSDRQANQEEKENEVQEIIKGLLLSPSSLIGLTEKIINKSRPKSNYVNHIRE